MKELTPHIKSALYISNESAWLRVTPLESATAWEPSQAPHMHWAQEVCLLWQGVVSSITHPSRSQPAVCPTLSSCCLFSSFWWCFTKGLFWTDFNLIESYKYNVMNFRILFTWIHQCQFCNGWFVSLFILYTHTLSLFFSFPLPSSSSSFFSPSSPYSSFLLLYLLNDLTVSCRYHDFCP